MPPPPPLIHLQRGSQRFGPYPATEVQTFVTQGRLFASDDAWHDGMSAPVSLGELFSRLGLTLPAVAAPPGQDNLKWILPVGRSGLAIAAGYLGLLSVLLVPARFALALGLIARNEIRKKPGRGGIGRAWFGIIAGALGTIAIPVLIIAGVVGPR